MKTKLIKGKVDILLVDGLPKNGGTNETFVIKDGQIQYFAYNGHLASRTKLPNNIQGNWKFVSTIEELTEEDAEKLFEIEPLESSIQTFYFHLGKNKVAIDPIQQSEYDVFNPSTTLIFVKK